MSAKGIIGERDLNKKTILENDPLEAIFALNLGDFLTEHLISEDLLTKINTSVHDKITQLKNQLKELVSIYSLDKTLTLLGFNSDEDFIIYNSIAKTITQMLGINACHIYLNTGYLKKSRKKYNFDLVLTGSSLREIKKSEYKNTGYSLEYKDNPPVKSFIKGQTFYIKNVKRNKNWQCQPNLNEDKVVTLLAVPMRNNSENVGVICLENYKAKEIAPEFIRLIEITARLFVTSMKLQKLVESTEQAIEDKNSTIMELRHLRTELTANIGDLGDDQQIFVEALASAVDAKSKFTQEHSRNIANLAKEISEYLKLNEKTIDLIYYAGLLHNIGKITLPEEIFSKQEKLSKEEWIKLQNHPNVGVNLLMKVNFLSEVVPYIHYHKERWDGMGEPEGLSGLSIPLGSRIIAVADAYQAMVSERPYRDPLSAKQVLEIMKKEAGIKWDPIIVDALTAIKE